jgi:hypothetical protein
VIEAYPGGAQDLLGLPRKGAGEERLRRALVRFGFSGDVAQRRLTHDELDAIACAYTGREHLAGRSLVLGTPDEAELVLPRPRRAPRRSGNRPAPEGAACAVPPPRGRGPPPAASRWDRGP